MHSPVFPSSPVCDQSDLKSISSRIPRHRRSAECIHAAALGAKSLITKLANATLGKVKSKKQKAPPVPKLLPISPTPVAINPRPCMDFFQMDKTDDPFGITPPCQLTSTVPKALLEGSSTSATIRRSHSHGPQVTPPAFVSPRFPNPRQSSSLLSSPTSELSNSSRLSHFTQSECTSSPSSSLHSDAPSTPMKFCRIDSRASTLCPSDSIPASSRRTWSNDSCCLSPSKTLHSPPTPPKITCYNLQTALQSPSSTPSKRWDGEPWRQYLLESPLISDPLYVPYEFLLSPPARTRSRARQATSRAMI